MFFCYFISLGNEFRTLRRLEKDVLVPELMRERLRTEHCLEKWEMWGKCGREHKWRTYSKCQHLLDDVSVIN